jgi:hypothetical protein
VKWIILHPEQWAQLHHLLSEDETNRQADRHTQLARDFLAEVSGSDIGENDPVRIEVEEQQ